MNPATSIHSQQLNQVLNTHRLFAMNALGGPALWTAEMAKLAANARFDYKSVIESLQQQQSTKEGSRNLPYDYKLSPTGLPIQPSPFFLTADSQSEHTNAILEGERIPCFEIGGEKRLCLPQILKTVLANFSLGVINQACDDLFIYCSRCTPQQLEMFKRAGDIPPTAATCGLITFTDAERLCSALLHESSPAPGLNLCRDVKNNMKKLVSEACLPIYHECFGTGNGLLRSNLYTSPDAKCVECTDCGKCFSVQHFVGHSHYNQENRVCHWGFDRKKWRNYILLDDDMVADEADVSRLEGVLNDVLQRFATANSDKSLSRKRKNTEDDSSAITKKESRNGFSHGSDSSTQLSPAASSASGTWLQTSPPTTFPGNPANFSWPVSAAQLLNSTNEALASFKSRIPTSQKTCAPVLLNPENVVLSSESSRYEKHFIPNISLQNADDQQKQEETMKPHKAVLLSDDTARSSPASPLSSHSEDLPNRQIFILDSLARMESQFLKVLMTCTADIKEKETMEHKYLALSDSVRSYLVNRNADCTSP